MVGNLRMESRVRCGSAKVRLLLLQPCIEGVRSGAGQSPGMSLTSRDRCAGVQSTVRIVELGCV